MNKTLEWLKGNIYPTLIGDKEDGTLDAELGLLHWLRNNNRKVTSDKDILVYITLYQSENKFNVKGNIEGYRALVESGVVESYRQIINRYINYIEEGNILGEVDKKMLFSLTNGRMIFKDQSMKDEFLSLVK